MGKSGHLFNGLYAALRVALVLHGLTSPIESRPPSAVIKAEPRPSFYVMGYSVHIWGTSSPSRICNKSFLIELRPSTEDGEWPNTK